MSQPVLLQNSWENGMRRDSARNSMPQASAWTIRDYILEYGAPLRARGGWDNGSPSATSISAGTAAASIKGGLYAVYSLTAGATPRNLIVDEDGQVYVFNNAAITAVGTGVTVAQNPVFHGGAAVSAGTAVYSGLAIIPDATGAAVPKKFNGNTLSDLNGSPPKARYASVFKDYTLLANGTVGGIEYPNRVWYSPAGDPDCFGTAGLTAWDTTDSWIDLTQRVKGIASTKNVHIVYGDDQMARIRGSIPPPDTDFTLDDPWLKVGLLDPQSITVYQDTVYWCAPEGVFRTDGVSLDDLTQKGGMLRYWLDLIYDAESDWTFATGVIRNHLIVSILDGGVFRDGFLIDLQSYTWTQLSNIPAYSFWDGVVEGTRSAETFFGRADIARVGALDSIFAGVGVSALMKDGGSTAVQPRLETPFFELGAPGLKVWKALYFGYALVDSFSANPAVSAYYIDSPEETSYTALGELDELAEYNRRRLRLGGRRPGLAFLFDQHGAGDQQLYNIMTDAYPLEGSKVT